MKLKILLLILAQSAFAETVEVYREVNVDHRSVEGIKIKENDSATWPRTFGIKLGIVETGDKKLSEIIKNFEERSWENEPFYGPCENYIFKDSKGAFYCAHFEFIKGHQILGKGVRFAITRLTQVEGAENVFTGSPYNGSSVYDQNISKQLRTIALTKPQAEQPVTNPVVEPDGGDKSQPQAEGRSR